MRMIQILFLGLGLLSFSSGVAWGDHWAGDLVPDHLYSGSDVIRLQQCVAFDTFIDSGASPGVVEATLGIQYDVDCALATDLDQSHSLTGADVIRLELCVVHQSFVESGIPSPQVDEVLGITFTSDCEFWQQTLGNRTLVWDSGLWGDYWSTQ